MTSSAPIMVRNTQPGPTVFTSSALSQHVEWQGASDPHGLDVQPCPSDFLNDVQFRSAVVRGIFEIESADDDVEKILGRHRDEWEMRQVRQREASEKSLDPVADEDLLMLTCIGPAARGQTELCGAEVPVKSKLSNEKPPLCNRHKALINQFLAEETGVIKGGKQEIRWIRTTVVNAVRQQD